MMHFFYFLNCELKIKLLVSNPTVTKVTENRQENSSCSKNRFPCHASNWSENVYIMQLFYLWKKKEKKKEVSISYTHMNGNFEAQVFKLNADLLYWENKGRSISWKQTTAMVHPHMVPLY